MLGIDSSLLTSRASGPSGEGVPETDVHAGHVRQEEGQSEEASSQTDQAGAARSPQTWGLHQIPSQLAGSVSTHPNLEHSHNAKPVQTHLEAFMLFIICTTLMLFVCSP